MVHLLKKRQSPHGKSPRYHTESEGGGGGEEEAMSEGGGSGGEVGKSLRSIGSKNSPSILDRTTSKAPAKSRLSKDGGGASMREGPPSGTQ